MFALVVRFDLKPGREAEFDGLVADTLIGIDHDESGTVIYATHLVTSEPSARVFYEVYRDRAAFDAHEAATHTASFLAKRDQYLAHPPRVEFLSEGRGKGVPNNRD